MDYYNNIQRSLDFIERHLRDDIGIAAIAQQSAFSIPHFYRIFHGMVGEGVMDYVRKRRLSEAAVELLSTNQRVIDIALKYSFSSPSVFTRAFKRTFGLTPKECRQTKRRITLFEKAHVIEQRDLFSDESRPHPSIIYDKAFKVVGMSRVVKPGGPDIRRLWQSFATRQPLIKCVVDSDVVMGICEYTPVVAPNGSFNYTAGVEVSEFSTIPNGLIAKSMPQCKYAVFTHKGPLSELKATYNSIFGRWLPSSVYVPAEEDVIELYDSRAANPLSPSFEFDIYLPVRRY